MATASQLSPLEQLEQYGTDPQPQSSPQPTATDSQGQQLSPLEQLERLGDSQPAPTPQPQNHGIPFGHTGMGFGSNDVTPEQAAGGVAGIGAATAAGIAPALYGPAEAFAKSPAGKALLDVITKYGSKALGGGAVATGYGIGHEAFHKAAQILGLTDKGSKQ